MKTLLYILILITLCHCAPSRIQCEKNYGKCGDQIEKYIYTRRDTTIYLPGSVIRDTLNRDIPYLTERVIADSTGRTELKYWRDAYGRLWVQCSTKPDSLKGSNTTEIRYYPAPVAKTSDSLMDRAAIYGLIVTLLLLGLVIALIVKYFKK